jgi:predicted phage gp36 major capsid-like protein
MPKSPKARKESSKREREEGRVSEESLNPFRKSTRTERSPSRSEEENLTKKIEKEMKTMLREMREAVREKKREQEREGIPKSSEVRKESSKGTTQKEFQNEKIPN